MATLPDTENAAQAGPKRARGNLVFTWTVATAGGLVAVPILGIILTMGLLAAWSNASDGPLVALIMGDLLGIAAGGIFIGWAQAWVLVHVGTATGWTRHVGGQWTAATACGWIIGLAGGYAAISLIGRLATEEWDSAPVTLAATLIALAIMGALLGLVQWLVLHTYVEHAGAWVAACAAGTAGGGILLSATLQLVTGYVTPLVGPDIKAFILAAGVGGAALGVVTGLALTTLLGVPALRPRPSA